MTESASKPKDRPEGRKLERVDYVRMNLPQEFWEASSKLIPSGVYPSVKHFGLNTHEFIRDGLGFVLCGPPGVGKSGAAAVLSKIVKCYGFTVLFVSISDLREMVRSRLDFDAQTPMLERARDVDFLVLDNLREEDAKEAIVNASSLDGLIAHRVSWKRSTVITTRMTQDGLRACFPDVWERVRGACAFLVVEGPDLREQLGAKVESRLTPKKA